MRTGAGPLRYTVREIDGRGAGEAGKVVRSAGGCRPRRCLLGEGFQGCQDALPHFTRCFRVKLYVTHFSILFFFFFFGFCAMSCPLS